MTGVTALERLIRQSPISKRTRCYIYEGRITVKEVLRLSGVKSAATLHHSHHKTTKTWLDGKLKELKALAGRGDVRKDLEERSEKARVRESKMAQELAAANYKIVELERLLALSEQRARKGSTVVPFKRKR